MEQGWSNMLNASIILDKLKKFNRDIQQELGKGQVLPVLYDTAFLALVPSLDLKSPAFPQVLSSLDEWQKSLVRKPVAGNHHSQSELLNILSLLLVRLKWQKENTPYLIKQLLDNAEALCPKILQEKYQTIGFELLFPMLIQEIKNLGQELPQPLSDLLTSYLPIQQAKLKKIKEVQQNIGEHQPMAWWFSLECLGDIFGQNQNITLNSNLLNDKGHVAGSPAATAYFLARNRYQGQDFPGALHYLNRALCEHNGFTGLGHVFPIDEFELSYCANFLYEAGMKKDSPAQSVIIKRLYHQWNKRNGLGVGYSSEFVLTEPDETACAIRALKLSGFDKVSSKILLKHYNNHYIETFLAEHQPSITTNLHGLYALKLDKEDSEVASAITNIMTWLKSQTQKDSPIFEDKWHASPFYPISRAVIVLSDLDDVVAYRCVKWLLDQQKEDGGFGKLQSTMEETALTSLSLCYWFKNTQHIPINIKEKLTKAFEFLLERNENFEPPLWMGKVLYHPKIVVKTIVISALIALENIIRIEQPAAKKKIVHEEEKSKIIYFNSKLQAQNEEIQVKKQDKEASNTLKNFFEKYKNNLVLENNKINTFSFDTLISISKFVSDENLLSNYLNYLSSINNCDSFFIDKNEVSIKRVISLILNNLKNCINNKFYKIKGDKNHDLYHVLNFSLKPIIDSDLDIFYFIESLKNSFYFIQDTVKTTNYQSIDALIYKKIQYSFIDSAFELALSCSRITLPIEARKHLFFKHLKYHGYRAAIIQRDLLNLDFENNHDHLILFKIKNTFLTREQAVIELNQLFQSEVSQFKHYHKVALEIYPPYNFPFIKDALDLLEQFIHLYTGAHRKTSCSIVSVKNSSTRN